MTPKVGFLHASAIEGEEDRKGLMVKENLDVLPCFRTLMYVEIVTQINRIQID